jgi:GNAT superfamily N-acetyltransferase
MMSAGVTVRQATPRDVDALASLHIRAWQWAYRAQLPDDFLDGLSSQLERRRRQWTEWLERPGASFALAAERDSAVAGFAHSGVARDADLPARWGELYAIYLEQREAGRGTGRMLMGRVVEGLASRGYESAVLWVLETNARARRFYEAGGWTPDGRTQEIDFGIFKAIEVRYRRDLPGRGRPANRC